MGGDTCMFDISVCFKLTSDVNSQVFCLVNFLSLFPIVGLPLFIFNNSPLDMSLLLCERPITHLDVVLSNIIHQTSFRLWQIDVFPMGIDDACKVSLNRNLDCQIYQFISHHAGLKPLFTYGHAFIAIDLEILFAPSREVKLFGLCLFVRWVFP